jgi:hypothetical protein
VSATSILEDGRGLLVLNRNTSWLVVRMVPTEAAITYRDGRRTTTGLWEVKSVHCKPRTDERTQAPKGVHKYDTCEEAAKHTFSIFTSQFRTQSKYTIGKLVNTYYLRIACISADVRLSTYQKNEIRSSKAYQNHPHGWVGKQRSIDSNMNCRIFKRLAKHTERIILLRLVKTHLLELNTDTSSRNEIKVIKILDN